MAQTQVVLVGAKRMRKQLKAGGANLADLREPYRNAAAIVVRAAKPRTPTRSGALKRSVRGAGSLSAGTVRAGGGKVPYANPIHWGWPVRRIKPQPWLSAAAQQSEPQWLPEFMAELDRTVDMIAKDYTT